MARKKVRGARKGIFKRNFVFYMFQPYVKRIFYQYYGKMEVRGRENIPRGEPVIFAPNHQNALMDALIVLFSSPQDMVFLARADIFSGRVAAFIFNSLKILPVFRQRDGASELGKNEDIFDISVDILKHRHFMCIMPEGNHGHQRRMRPFGKGIFRIGFAAQKEHGAKPFVKIVPATIDMGDYVKHNASLLLTFGEPIELSDYWEQYDESAPRAINAAKKDLIAGMKPGMIHISTDEYYDTVMSLREIYNDIMRAELGIEGTKLSDRFTADKEMIARIEAVIEAETAAAATATASTASTISTTSTASTISTASTASTISTSSTTPMKALDAMVQKYTAGIKEMNIREWVVREKGYGALKSLGSFVALLLSSPFFFYGYLANIIPYWIPVHLVRNMKDRQFHSSVKFAIGMLLTFPPWYVITTVLVGIFTGPWWVWVAYLLTVYPLGKFALKWYGWWKKTTRGSWFGRSYRRGDARVVGLVSQREEIIEATQKLIAR